MLKTLLLQLLELIMKSGTRNSVKIKPSLKRNVTTPKELHEKKVMAER